MNGLARAWAQRASAWHPKVSLPCHLRHRRALAYSAGTGTGTGMGEGRVSVWWDMEACKIPKDVEPGNVAARIMSFLRASGASGPASIHAYGDALQLPRHTAHALDSTGISFHHVPNSGGKDCASKILLVDLLSWALENPPPAYLFLISGDQDFSSILYRLKMNNYNILTANPICSSLEVDTSVSLVWQWNSLVQANHELGKHGKSPSDSSQCKRIRNINVIEDSNNNIVAASDTQEQLTTLSVPESSAVPETVKQKIALILQSFPNGLILQRFSKEMARHGIDHGSNYFGYKRFLKFLHAIPDVVKLSKLDGKNWICNATSKSTDNSCTNVALSTIKISDANKRANIPVELEVKESFTAIEQVAENHKGTTDGAGQILHCRPVDMVEKDSFCSITGESSGHVKIGKEKDMILLSNPKLWEEVKQFVLSKQGTDLISEAMSREDIIKTLQKHGTPMFCNLNEKLVRQIVCSLIDDKKWVEEVSGKFFIRLGSLGREKTVSQVLSKKPISLSALFEKTLPSQRTEKTKHGKTLSVTKKTDLSSTDSSPISASQPLKETNRAKAGLESNKVLHPSTKKQADNSNDDLLKELLGLDNSATTHSTGKDDCIPNRIRVLTKSSIHSLKTAEPEVELAGAEIKACTDDLSAKDNLSSEKKSHIADTDITSKKRVDKDHDAAVQEWEELGPVIEEQCEGKVPHKGLQKKENREGTSDNSHREGKGKEENSSVISHFKSRSHTVSSRQSNRKKVSYQKRLTGSQKNDTEALLSHVISILRKKGL